MTVDLSTPHITAVLERAGMLPTPPQVLGQLGAACADVGGDTDAVLEISRARWATATQGPDEVLVVLMRKVVVLVEMRKRGLFKAPEPSPRTVPLADYRDVADEDETLEHSVFFLAPSEDDHFLLSWSNPSERDRMYRAIFHAHSGHYAQWGLQLDPSNYVQDFDRYYAQIVAEGPTNTDGWYDWREETFGEFDLSNALGFASEWRQCELRDAAGREPSSRVMRIGNPQPFVDNGPEAERVVVRLGEQLFDDGLLNPPYDEYSFSTDEPLRPLDAGPARLIGLMRLATSARALMHPRAAEWIEAARAGIPAVPPTVFSENLRELWSKIEDLTPVDDGPAPEIPIWDDADVRTISTREDDCVSYSMDGLTNADKALVTRFLDIDQALGEDGPPNGQAVAEVCLLGVRTFEGLSSDAPVGWRKLVLYGVSDLTYGLWEQHKLNREAAILAHWVISTIEANHWGPDGRTTVLGQHHSYMFAVGNGTGVGIIQIDPETGLASAPTGDDARQAAALGHF